MAYKSDEEIVEELRPKVTVLPAQEVRWDNAKHILQFALDEWYKDFEPALLATLKQVRDEEYGKGFDAGAQTALTHVNTHQLTI